MQHFILRVDFDGGDDEARWMIVSTDKVEDYKNIRSLLGNIREDLNTDKIVCSHRDSLVVLRTLPDGLTDEEKSRLNDAGWTLTSNVGYYSNNQEINVEWKKVHIDKHGEICFTCDYKHTDYGIRSAYIPLSAL